MIESVNGLRPLASVEFRAEPFIVGIGGTTSAGSTTERALELALASAKREGARVRLFQGEGLTSMPHYGTEGSQTSVGRAGAAL